jgi:DEAD/DEAH box helicase domain-containing protein
MAFEKSSLQIILDQWVHNEQYYENITHVHVNKPTTGKFFPFPENLDKDLKNGLIDTGIHNLYSHQVQCYDIMGSGKNVLLNTETASGKTLAFLLPILNENLKGNISANALFLFPTKALAQDQYQQYQMILQSVKFDYQKKNSRIPTISVYDGDTPQSKRSSIRKNVNFLISNPDMLHFAILPNHTRWDDFFAKIKYVVIDEVHIYRGVFGSHIANVIRRLKRISALYGSQLQFVCTSATIGNAKQFTEKLIGDEVNVINENGAPHGHKTITFYNPPIENLSLGIRKSALSESIRIADNFVKKNIQTLVFQLSRRSVELSIKIYREKFSADADYVRSYRSGYLAEDRRKLEKDLRNEKIKLLFSTNALELGMDIGGISNVIISGYPGSIASTLQQIGRSGRKNLDSSAVLIANDSPIDQYLIKRPELFFINSPENALIDPENPLIMLQHIRCAVHELMFFEGESLGPLSWDQIKPYLEIIADEGNILEDKGKYFWISEKYPAENTQLRNSGGNLIILFDEDEQKVIGQVDYSSSLWMVHKEAIYMHSGEQYLVRDLNLSESKAYLSKNSSNYYTEPKRKTDVRIIDKKYEAIIGGKQITLGNIEVERKVTGFREILWDSRQTLTEKELDLPAIKMETEALWFVIDENIINNLREQNLWSSEKNYYGVNWNNIKKSVRERDQYTCQLCGLIETNRAHHVHHKIPFKLFDSLEDANKLSNLISLCFKCHQKVEISVKIKSGISGLAYLMRTMAPIFLMCSSEDVDVYIDQNSPQFFDLPLVMLYDNVPFGIGLSQHMFQIFPQFLTELLAHVKLCPCQNGCPSCVGPVLENNYGGKEETTALLSLLLENNG